FVREPQDPPAVARRLHRHPLADPAEAREIVMRDEAHVERERLVAARSRHVTRGVHSHLVSHKSALPLIGFENVAERTEGPMRLLKSLILSSALGLVATVATILAMSDALAQAYPSKPVKLVVTYPPAGSSDLMARILAQKLSEAWGQPVIVENKPGAAGSIGMDYAAHQPPDGYSFVIGNLGPVAVNPLLSKVPYDLERDFIPVS